METKMSDLFGSMVFNDDVMKQRLKAKLKRNLTRDEWNYFIGKNVPYEKIKDEK